MPYLPLPPSEVTGSLGDYLMVLWRTVSNMPNSSMFSVTDPNSAVTGLPGDFLSNIGSASTTSRLWIKGGGLRTPSTTGWAAVRILE